MIYLEYEECKQKYAEAQKRFDAVLTEQERLFTKTLPNAIRYDMVNVQVSVGSNNVEEYIIAMQEKGIDEKLKECRQNLEDRARLLKAKEEELKKSHDKMDKIYILKYLDGFNYLQIAEALNYSKTQVYRILNKIHREITKK